MASQPHSDHGYSCGDPSSTSLTQTINPFFEKLQQLREKQLYCDLVLVVQGAKFSCHRAVIASWSPYIHSMLNMKNVEKEMFTVNFSNVSVFAAVLNYMYTNVLDLQEVNLIQVLHLATSFQIQPLREMCEGSLRCNLHVGNIISTFQLARKFQLSSLEDFCLTYLQMHLPDAVKQNDFLNLSAMRFNNFLSSGFVTTLKPEVKLFLIISWLGYDVKEREQYFVVLLGHIDWSTVANDFLTEISQTENFFTTNESSLYLLLQTLHSSGISLGPYTNAFADLRSKYSYLLSQVVQSSVWKTTPEVFTPVTVTHSAVSQVSRSRFHPTGMSVGVQTDKTGESGKSCTTQQEDEKSLVDKAEPEWEEHKGEDPQAYEEEETPRRRTSSRKSLRPKKLTRVKKKPRKSRKQKDVKQKEALNEGGMVPRRESSRVPKPIVYEGFDNGEDSDWDETEPVKDEEAPQDDAVEAAEEEDAVKQEEGPGKGDKEQKEEQNEEEDEVRFHRMAHELQFEHQDRDQEQDQEEENNEDNDEFDDDEDEDESIDTPDTQRRRRGRPKKGMEVEKQKCDKCSYVARTVGKLRNHMKKTHEDGIGFRCSLCDFECQWSKEYYIHCKGHYGEPPYRCDFLDCKETFDRIHAIVMHKEKHNNERKWACGKCPARFRSRNNLASHRRCHSGLKPFECDICQRKFATKNTMTQHKVTHSDDRPYLCDTCGFATKYQSHLIAHRRIHSGDVYHCHFPGCKYITPKRSQLKAHMRSHLGIRRFACPTCGKAFVEKSHLVRHERIHLEQKPYKCTECEYNSARGDKLKDHILRHHGANSTDKSQKYPTVRRQRKITTKLSTVPVNVVPLPHPPYSDTPEDPNLQAKQNPQPLVLSEHGYVRMSAPNDDPSQLQHGRHLGTVLEIPTGLNGQQGISSHVPQQQTMHMPSQPPPTSHQTQPPHQPQQSHQPQHQPLQAQVQQHQQHHQQPHIQVLSNMESFTVHPTSTVLVSTHNSHQHQQQQQQQHPQHSQQQQQQQQHQQHDYGGLGAFMALF